MIPGLGNAPVEAVIFDYGMTLVTYSRPEAALQNAYVLIARSLEQHTGRPIPAPARLLADIHDRVEAEITARESAGHLEEVDHTRLAQDAYAAIGLDLEVSTVDSLLEIEQRAWWEGMCLAPEVLPTLRHLHDLNLAIGLCSNAPYRPASLHGQLRHLGLSGMLDAVTFSSEVGWRKPSSHIFTQALISLDQTPAHTIVVGDRSREDIDGAHISGMRAVRLRQHHDDAVTPERADVVLDHLSQLPEMLIEHARR